MPKDINITDFEIPFSVRIDSEAHMFLCDENSSNSSVNSCYWIILGGWEGQKTAITKCSEKQILNNFDDYLTDPCSKAPSTTDVSFYSFKSISINKAYFSTIK